MSGVATSECDVMDGARSFTISCLIMGCYDLCIALMLNFVIKAGSGLALAIIK